MVKDTRLQLTCKQGSVQQLSHPHRRVHDSALGEAVDEEQQRRDAVHAGKQHRQYGKLVECSTVQDLRGQGGDGEDIKQAAATAAAAIYGG